MNEQADVAVVDPDADYQVVPVEDTDSAVLAGAASAGPAGGKALYGPNAAMHAEAPVNRLRHTTHTYPAFHRTARATLGARG